MSTPGSPTCSPRDSRDRPRAPLHAYSRGLVSSSAPGTPKDVAGVCTACVQTVELGFVSLLQQLRRQVVKPFVKRVRQLGRRAAHWHQAGPSTSPETSPTSDPGQSAAQLASPGVDPSSTAPAAVTQLSQQAAQVQVQGGPAVQSQALSERRFARLPGPVARPQVYHVVMPLSPQSQTVMMARQHGYVQPPPQSQPLLNLPSGRISGGAVWGITAAVAPPAPATTLAASLQPLDQQTAAPPPQPWTYALSTASGIVRIRPVNSELCPVILSRPPQPVTRLPGPPLINTSARPTVGPVAVFTATRAETSAATDAGRSVDDRRRNDSSDSGTEASLCEDDVRRGDQGAARY